MYIYVPLYGNLRSSNGRKIIDVRNCNNSISFKTCTVWNKLPRDLRECSSISDFKSLIIYYFKLAFDV